MSNKKSGSGLGIIVILIGITALLMNFNILSFDMFWGISQLWPMIFIVIGLSILLKSIRYMGTILWLVFIGIIIAYSFINMDEKSWSVGGDAKLTSFEETVETFETGTLKLNVKTGAVNINSGEASKLLYTVPAEYMNPVEFDNSSNKLNLVFEENTKDKVSISKNKSYDITLPEEGTWKLDLDTGVGETTLNLEGLKIYGMKLDTGVGECNIFFGEITQGDIDIDMGIGEVVINIPDNIGVKLYVDSGIGSIDVPKNYKKSGGYYKSENYDKAEYFITIKVDVGVGSFKIK